MMKRNGRRKLLSPGREIRPGQWRLLQDAKDRLRNKYGLQLALTWAAGARFLQFELATGDPKANRVLTPPYNAVQCVLFLDGLSAAIAGLPRPAGHPRHNQAERKAGWDALRQVASPLTAAKLFGAIECKRYACDEVEL